MKGRVWGERRAVVCLEVFKLSRHVTDVWVALLTWVYFHSDGLLIIIILLWDFIFLFCGWLIPNVYINNKIIKCLTWAWSNKCGKISDIISQIWSKEIQGRLNPSIIPYSWCFTSKQTWYVDWVCWEHMSNINQNWNNKARGCGTKPTQPLIQAE